MLCMLMNQNIYKRLVISLFNSNSTFIFVFIFKKSTLPLVVEMLLVGETSSSRKIKKQINKTPFVIVSSPAGQWPMVHEQWRLLSSSSMQ